MKTDVMDDISSNSNSESDCPSHEHKKVNKKNAKIHKPSKSYSSYPVAATFLYHPKADFSDLSSFINCHIEVKIEKCYLLNKKLSTQIYGSDCYASLSDLASIAIHSSLFTREELNKKNFSAISLIMHVSKNKRHYGSSNRNGVVTKKISSSIYQTIKPISVKFLSNLKLETIFRSTEFVKLKSSKRTKNPSRRLEKENYLAPMSVVFNSNNELMLEYTLSNICDIGNDPKDFLSQQLRNYWMLIENQNNNKIVVQIKDMEKLKFLAAEPLYRVSKVESPELFDNNFVNNYGLTKNITTVLDNITWDNIIWGRNEILFRETNFRFENPKSFKLYPVTRERKSVQICQDKSYK